MRQRPLCAAVLLLSGCAFQDVKVMTDPPRADIIVDGAPQGKEPVTAKLATDSFANVLGKKHEIVAKLEGYEDEVLRLESASNFFSDTSPFPRAITMKLKPLPGTARPGLDDKPRFPSAPAVAEFPKGERRPEDVAVIIGNADYSRGRDIPNVHPAYADAEGFKLYAESTLGIGSGNIIFLKDATGAQLQRVFGTEANHKGQLFDWVKPGRSRVFVYYAGHGAPSTKDGDAYLVPSDADAGRIELSGYALKTLYENLGQLPAESVSVVIEACFSGNSHGGSLIAKASPLISVTKKVEVPAKLDVFTAGASGQIASWEEDKAHSLFSAYYLRGAAGEADKAPYGNDDGRVDAPELQRYLLDKVTYAARRAYGRDQTPEHHAGN